MLCSNLLGVKANLCLHNSQYSFLLYFNHCTKLENEKQQMSLNPFFYINWYKSDGIYNTCSNTLTVCINIYWMISGAKIIFIPKALIWICDIISANE